MTGLALNLLHYPANNVDMRQVIRSSEMTDQDKRFNPSAATFLRLLGVSTIMTLGLTACASEGGSMYNGSTIQVKATQTQLKSDVSLVSNEYRELRDRFDVLERLYVDLAKSLGTQNQSVKELASAFQEVEADPVLENQLIQAKAEIAVLKNNFQELQDRLFSVERVSNVGPYEQLESQNTDISAQPPVRQPVTTPIETQPIQPEPTDTVQPVANFGIHLESLRQREQAGQSLTRLRESYPAVLDPLSVRLYQQSRSGLTIFRLIIGPFESEGEAEQTCGIIRSIEPDQYCRVTEFEGVDFP